MKITVKAQDYLFGCRSKHYQNNGGNVLVKALVAQLFWEYETADIRSDYLDKDKKKRDKHVIKQDIIDAVKAKGGRFLKRLEHDEWLAASDKQAHSRIVEEFKLIRKKSTLSSSPANMEQPTTREEETHARLPRSDDESLENIVIQDLGAKNDLADGDAEESFAVANNNSGRESTGWTLVAPVASHDQYYSPTPSFVSLAVKGCSQQRLLPDAQVMKFRGAKTDDDISLSLLGSLAGMSIGTGTQQQQAGSNEVAFADSSHQTSDASGGVATSSISGEAMSFLSISESKAGGALPYPVVDGQQRINKTFAASASSMTDVVMGVSGSSSRYLPRSLMFVNVEDDSTSKTSTNAVENILDKLARMQESSDDVNLVAEHTDALAGETLKYYGNEDEEEESDEWRGRFNIKSISNKKPPSHGRRSRVVGTVNAETITMLLDVVKLHPNHLSIQKNSCLILSNLARSRENLGAIARAGSVWIVGAMKRAKPDNEEMQRVCSHALSNLALNDSNRMAIGECGGIAALIRAMSNNPNEEKLQRYASNALGNLARGKKGANRQQIKSEGGVKLLVAAMKNFPSSCHLQQCCLRSFGNLAKDQIGRTAIFDADGIRQVVEALNKSTSQEYYHEELQESGCHALGNLCMSMDIAIEIVNVGGIQCIIRAMQLYDKNEELQRYGCFAFFYVTRHCYLKIEGEGHHNSIKGMVEAAMSKFPLSKHVRKYGKKTLDNISHQQLLSSRGT